MFRFANGVEHRVHPLGNIVSDPLNREKLSNARLFLKAQMVNSNTR